MIKAVIFDVGGVLMYDCMPEVFADITQTLQLDKPTFQKAWDELTPLLGAGKITEDTFWKNFGEKTRSSKKLPKESLLQRNYKAVPNDEVMKIVKQLKEKKYKLAVLSNTIASHVEINKHVGLYDDFPLQIFSNEVGYNKPTKEIYLLTSKKLETKPEETIFIDDNLANVKVANSLGFHGIHFTTAAELKKELLKQGVQL